MIIYLVVVSGCVGFSGSTGFGRGPFSPFIVHLSFPSIISPSIVHPSCVKVAPNQSPSFPHIYTAGYGSFLLPSLIVTFFNSTFDGY